MDKVLFYHSDAMDQNDMDLIERALLRNERLAVESLISHLTFSEKFLKQVSHYALSLIETVRMQHKFSGPIDAMLIEYALSSEEGIALMCLGEALMRIPDPQKQDLLIKEKILSSNWENRSGKSGMMLANAAAWGLLVSGKLLKDEESIFTTLRKLLKRLGAPVIRTVIKRFLRQLANQFILGETIQEALKNARALAKQGYLFSFDMLGESALTKVDADFYFNQYQLAIESLSTDASTPIERAHSVSVKLSALCPFFEVWHEKQAVDFLVNRMLQLVKLAKKHHVAICIDAEENSRLTLTLAVFRNVLKNKALSDWKGFGFALQAYHKGAVEVIHWLVNELRAHNRFAQIRLVKGAYWDTEIKIAQQLGLEQYPVYTQKPHTDCSYAACAKLLLAAQDVIFPQFATHNAYTLSLIQNMVNTDSRYEFQCLRGMGKPLYDTFLKEQSKVSVRMYAPVGVHEDLLPYLVRRILENGANSSFVNQLVDEEIDAKILAQNPIANVGKNQIWQHPNIQLPIDIFGNSRRNSEGKQLANGSHAKQMINAMNQVQLKAHIRPLTKAKLHLDPAVDIVSPHDHDQVLGSRELAQVEMVPDIALVADRAQKEWQSYDVIHRAAILNKAADLMQQRQFNLMAATILEAGKTYQDAIDEVREAIDFLRYYANECLLLEDKILPGPTGEENRLIYVPTGPTLCISPWNFPVAIFIGQISAALAAGNAVIAKPATQTLICATWASECLYDAGLPKSALQVIPCEKDVAGKLVSHLSIKQVLFTGSNQTATVIYQTLSQRSGPITPLIAETGGINVMIADSSALPEQVVKDVMHSAFQSAGQRCSACRILCVQTDIADKVIQMLIGAMAYWRVGSPQNMATQVGPVIDQAAMERLLSHKNYLDEHAQLLATMTAENECKKGTFFMPCVYEIDDLSMIDQEVFGPILHVYRYQEKAFDQVLDAINATGYGLTLGVHSRIEGFVKQVIERTSVGNNYVNRNMIGAVVGVQPFGGMGCSGTGPKAGGPSYVKRFCKEKTISTNTAAIGGNVSLLVGK